MKKKKIKKVLVKHNAAIRFMYQINIKNLLQFDVVGEIYIRGHEIGKGYHNRIELTIEKFIENTFNFDDDEHNRIMNKTGYLGKQTSEGETESKVLEVDGIQQCVVINKKKENGEKNFFLLLYFN